MYPALAVADEIRRRDPGARFLYVGVRGRLEERVVPGRGYELRFVRSRPFPRSTAPLALLRFGVTLAAGVVAAALLLLRFRPDVIFGTGGFASAPIMFACGALRKVGLCRAKLFVYEPNAHPGLLNQAVGRIADRVGVVFEQAGRWFDMKRVAIVGFPVRRELLDLDRAGARRALAIGAERFVVFAFGGSQGSRVINRAVVEALPHLRDRRDELFVLHATGRYATDEYDAVADTQAALAALCLGATDDWYRRVEYMENIQLAYAAADVVVCRGGISTLTEVGVCSLPAVVVPLSTAAEDHQAVNARALQRQGAALVLYEEARWRPAPGAVDLCVRGERLAAAIADLLEHLEERRRMADAAHRMPRRDSLELILGELDNLVHGRRPGPLTLEFPVVEAGVPTDPNRLLRHVRRRVEESGGVERMCPRERSYLRYQADRQLASEEWYEIPYGRRNVGVKIVGLLRYEERLDLMLALLQDRRRAGRLQRLVGGDYRHPGILRRNIVDFPLAMIGLKGREPIRAALLDALARDPYFEVRSAAARVLGEQSPADAEVEEALTRALDDRSETVVVAVLRALSRVARRPELLSRLRGFYAHADWCFRQETVRALTGLLERGVLRPRDIAADIDQILSTSPNFEPAFPLKESLEGLVRKVREGIAREGTAQARGNGEDCARPRTGAR